MVRQSNQTPRPIQDLNIYTSSDETGGSNTLLSGKPAIRLDESIARQSPATGKGRGNPPRWNDDSRTSDARAQHGARLRANCAERTRYKPPVRISVGSERSRSGDAATDRVRRAARTGLAQLL